MLDVQGNKNKDVFDCTISPLPVSLLNKGDDHIEVTNLLDIHGTVSKRVGHDMICSHGKSDCVDGRVAKGKPLPVHFNRFDALTQLEEVVDFVALGPCKKHAYVDCAVCGDVITPTVTHFNDESSQNPWRRDGAEPRPFSPPARSQYFPAFSGLGDPPPSSRPPSASRVPPVRPEVDPDPGCASVLAAVQDGHTAHSGSRRLELRSRDSVRSRTVPVERVPHPRPTDPTIGPVVETGFEVGVSRGRVNFGHDSLGRPGPPVLSGQLSPPRSSRTPYHRPVCVAQDLSAPLDLSVPGSRARVVSETVTTMVCTTSQEVCCSSLSPQPRGPRPAASDVSCGPRDQDVNRLPRATRLAGSAALRTHAFSNLRRAHVRRVRLERTETLSRGRAQAVTALALPATPQAVEDVPRHPVVPDPTVHGPRLGVQVPPARRRRVAALDAHRERFLRDGFSEGTVDLMLAARKNSTNAQYQGYWARFADFCALRDIDPFEAPIQEILRFVEQTRRARTWSYPTTKNCLAAITALRGKLDGVTVFTHPCTHAFLQGAKSKDEGRIRRAETWDPSLVLRALESAPFEPLGTVDLKWVSLKLAVLLLLTTAARGSEIAALTVKDMQFSAAGEQVTIYPDLSFVPKTCTRVQSMAPVVFHAFYPKPRTRDEKRYNLSCPVRALRIYHTRTAVIRRTEKLLVTFGTRFGVPGGPLSSKRLAGWLVEAITEAYARSDRQVPRLTAHSTRAVATSTALAAGVDWEVIRQTAAWQGDLTFRTHYYRYVRVASVADAVLHQVTQR